MDELTVKCPKCKHRFPLTESLAAPLVENLHAQHRLELQEKDKKAAEKLEAELERIVNEEREKAKRIVADDVNRKNMALRDLTQELDMKDAKLAEAQKSQAEFMKKERALEDRQRELDLIIEKSVQSEVSAVREQARREIEDSLGLKITEKEETISSMMKQIEDLKRKAEQGSQQSQGEALEVELENLFRSKFPQDEIVPVPKGEFGGDILQKVIGPSGKTCGTIIWESKRTKAWSDGWLPKLRGDQRAAKAEIAAIVTQALPSGVETFDLVDGVWVSSVGAALPIAIALRQVLIEASLVRQASEGVKDKAEIVYEYVVGPRFKQRVQAIVEAFSVMKEDLDKERKSTTRQWAKREEQLSRAVESAAGMYGDLQGMTVRALAEIEGLEAA